MYQRCFWENEFFQGNRGPEVQQEEPEPIAEPIVKPELVKPNNYYKGIRKLYRTKHEHDMYISGNEVFCSLNIVFEPRFIDKAGLAGQRILIDIVNSSMLALKFSKSGYKISDTPNCKNGGIRLAINNREIFNNYLNAGFIPSEFDAEKIEKKGIWILTRVESEHGKN